mmetsp:Transcript_12069/g.26876  ORF Transcript_12069/g.26876 Transcript_12069/m.26876 type:complete len:276 (+) Transcript_12069:79-906(+)
MASIRRQPLARRALATVLLPLCLFLVLAGPTQSLRWARGVTSISATNQRGVDSVEGLYLHRFINSVEGGDFCRRGSSPRAGRQSVRLQAGEWWLGSEDEIVVQQRINRAPVSESLFDSMYRDEQHDSSAVHSISQQSLRDICESYQFSLSYLGDFVSQLGCATPVDVDTAVGNFMTGEQVYQLLQALTSLDPFESNEGYDAVSIHDLADELQVPVSRIVKMCSKEGFNLPYGTDTALHVSVVDRLRKLAEYDDFRNDELEEKFGDDESIIDVEVV